MGPNISLSPRGPSRLRKGAYYEIHDTRGLEAGKSLLTGFKGIAVTDGYGVHDALKKRMPGLRLAQCWAHIRRRYVDCESAFPKETEQIIALIAELYAIEDRAPPGSDGDDVRRQLRTTESRCVLARIQAWCGGVAGTAGSRLAKAIEYMSRRWSKATLFLEHPDVPLDNNGAERAIRGLDPAAEPILPHEVTRALLRPSARAWQPRPVSGDGLGRGHTSHRNPLTSGVLSGGPSRGRRASQRCTT
jgi:hypothetical protein